MVFYIQQKVSEKTYVKKEKENMLILGNGRVITRDESMPFLENGAVALDGNTICKVGTLEEIRGAYPEAEYIDAKGGVIMPAFINAHEHIYSSFARGLSINLSLIHISLYH